MKDLVQLEKAKAKINIIKDLIKQLGVYNSINNYDNTKRFTIRLNYGYDNINNCYNYNIQVLRGINEHIIMNLRLKYKEKLDFLFDELLNDLINDENFKYTSYYSRNKEATSYNIHLDNDIIIEFPINNELDKVKYDKIEENFKNKKITLNYNPIDMNDDIKDEVQKEKAIKSIGIVKAILDSLCKMNDIENYDNNKNYRLVVSNKPLEDCNKFTFSIIRGVNYEEEIFKINISIKDTKIVYNEIFDLMVNYLNREDFKLFTLTKPIYGEKLNIELHNLVTLEFKMNTEEDKKFYNAFFNEFRDDVYKLDHKLIGHKLELK